MERAAVQWRPRAACREIQNARCTRCFSRFLFILREDTRLTPGGLWRRQLTLHACRIANGGQRVVFATEGRKLHHFS